MSQKQTVSATHRYTTVGCNGTLYLSAAGCRPDWHAGKRAATSWRQPSWLPVNAASSRVFPKQKCVATDSEPFKALFEAQQTRARQVACRIWQRALTARACEHFIRESADKIPLRMCSAFHQFQDNPSFDWPSPDTLLFRPLWLAAAGGVAWVTGRLLRLVPRRFAAPLPPAAQRFRHSRKRAGLTGTPAAFNSSTSCLPLQPCDPASLTVTTFHPTLFGSPSTFLSNA